MSSHGFPAPPGVTLHYADLYNASTAHVHVLISLSTFALLWLSIINARFDPFRFRRPRSLLLAPAIIPLLGWVTRGLGGGKYHYVTFEVAPFFHPPPVVEGGMALALAFLANGSGAQGGWGGLALRVVPLYWSVVTLMAMTPIYSDRTKQSVLVWFGTTVDTLVLLAAAAWAGLYCLVLAFRIVRWAARKVGAGVDAVMGWFA